MTVTNYFPRKEDLVFARAEAVIRSLADVVASRAPGESLLAAIRRDYAERVARADVTIGLSSPEFADDREQPGPRQPRPGNAVRA